MSSSRFLLTNRPIDTVALVKAQSDPGAGALAVFEGRVRNQNRDRPVIALAYEAAEDLAGNEFEKIAKETLDRFNILRLLCVHRTGRLEIGETAVWIGVLAAHRGDAFDACRFVIDQLKERLPIWKKEHYADGDSGWIAG